MRFDMTKGQDARYMVSVYRWNGNDFYYFHYFKDAKKLYDDVKGKEEKGTSVSIWDMTRDIRKDYVRV